MRRIDSWRLLVAALITLACWSSEAAAQTAPLHERIDALIEVGLEDAAAPLVDDATFCRRAYLDFFGRTPSPAEVRTFLADTAADKRARLIDALLSAPEFARQLSVWLDVTLMERRADKNVPTAEWRKYLFDSALANKPYDQLVREILSADGADPATRAAAKFYLDRDAEPYSMTRDIGRMLFGMDLQCAQCHDHPLVSDYHQEDYHGLLAFVNRTTLFTDAENKVSLAEKAEGETNYQSVFVPEQKGTIGPTLPGGLPIEEPTFAKGEEYSVAPADKVRSVPKHSRRLALATSATDGGNRAFNRNIANRAWAFVFGRGLVEPVDFQHPDNPPTQPEVLELLADEVVTLKYDLRALFRELALTHAYSRALELPAQLPPRAENQLADCEKACEAARQQATAAAQVVTECRDKLTAAGQTVSQANAEAQLAQAALASADQAVKDAQAAMTAAQTQLAAQEALARSLTEAAEKTASVAARLPEDQEIAAALATIKARGETVAAAISTLSQSMSQCQSDIGAKEAACAAGREKFTACDASLQAARAQQATQTNAWRSASHDAAVAAGKAAAAKQSLAALQAMNAYGAANQAVDAAALAKTNALGQMTVAVNAAKAPPEAPSASTPAGDDLGSARVVLASYRASLSEQERIADQLAAALAAVESADANCTAAHSAVNEAYGKLQKNWADRCLTANVSQLTPEQLAWSTWQALGVLDQQRAAAGAEWDAAHPVEGSSDTAEQRAAARATFVEQKVYDNLQGNVATFVNLFGGAPGQPQQVFQATADQALFFANGGELRSWLAPGGGNLTERLLALTDTQAFAEELYLTVFTRAPAAEEVEMVRSYLAGREQDRAAAVQEIVWALVTSAEFRFGT